MSGATAKKESTGGRRSAAKPAPAGKAPKAPAKVVRLTAADMAEKQREYEAIARDMGIIKK